MRSGISCITRGRHGWRRRWRTARPRGPHPPTAAIAGERASDPDLDLANAQGLVAQRGAAAGGLACLRRGAPGEGEPGDGWARWCQDLAARPQTAECQASPILPGALLHEALWQRAAGAVHDVGDAVRAGDLRAISRAVRRPCRCATVKQVASPFDPGRADILRAADGVGAGQPGGTYPRVD